MNKLFKKRYFYNFFLALSLVTLFVYFYGIPTGMTYSSSGSTIAPLADKTQLPNFAENIFIGEVLTQTGNRGKKNDDGVIVVPNTQYKVNVVSEIKGDVKNTITVSQYGGIMKQNSIRFTVLYNDEPLLEKKETYLFFTSGTAELPEGVAQSEYHEYNHNKDWHYLIAGYGAVKIDENTNVDELLAEYNLD